ncbi:endonuclease NucS domain-containing protein [Neobacillus massiliamazoniensis]|uniref:Restriction endonuclease-like protein n=1 Tax=Neobacillus massiliamazoniensis TaxID=1499688 RepID=A0A0U1NQQ3_9BACI|nr:endonuclease NucS domain-containing protein [Neobacillus massiliamazoniensis]CRK80383.1 restriction endonuclease-like protein [Neobacillus massiliamazoniensis]
MASYLIGYVDPEKNNSHEDPMFQELTYGDLKLNGEKLLGVNKGDYLFFHKTIYDKRYITAYYFVEEVHLVKNLLDDPLIIDKYNNPHLKKKISDLNINETIVFGNPIRSKVLEIPLELNEGLLKQLSRPAKLNADQTTLAAISSALRTWKELNVSDITLLLVLIKGNEKKGRLNNRLLSTEEVFHVLERDIEKYIASNPEILGEGLKLLKQQHVFSDESRLDLLLKDTLNDEIIVVEIKKDRIGREVKQQLKHYMRLCEDELGYSNIKGLVVCPGILPYFEDELLTAKKENIFVKIFGWKLDVI